MSLFNLMLRSLLSYLQKLAEQSLSLWDVPEDARMRLINVAENTTYLVDASQGNKAILRVRGQNTYIARHRK
jgi:Ser/Thr protein kinase RdoA (MazF antagonist)|tara:strand:- start:204 stop:419 length:216 start_codon:yes stop_codon:yes gene_type:complete